MKTLFKLWFLLLIVFFTSCDDKVSEMRDDDQAVLMEALAITDSGLIPCTATTVVPTTITQLDIDNILYMREEEKLANEIYEIFYNNFKRKVYLNISASEVKHREAIEWLINIFEIPVPPSTAQGVYSIEELQNLYNQITTNSTTLAQALNSSAFIEEHDILDLRKAISETENMYVKHVFTNLENASENHLRAFVKNMQRLNIEYTPQLLSQEEFDEIIIN